MSHLVTTSPADQAKTLENRLNVLNYGVFLQALLAMMGSLYYSTFGDPVKNLISGRFFPSNGGFEPCELCWFGRILMYPLVFISGVALLKEDKKFTDYVLPLSVPGVALAFYHYGLQKLSFPNPFRCTAANPCSALQVNYLGFITIPFLELVAFVVITALCVWQIKTRRELAKLGTSED
jgi:disulfide bond formation protein DsbB